MADYPINVRRARAIRARFAARAEALQIRVEELRFEGDNATADLLQTQVDSWQRMAAKQYETMPVVGHIS